MKYPGVVSTRVVLFVLVASVAAAAVVWLVRSPERLTRHIPTVARHIPFDEYEKWARSDFHRRHPEQRPLNWRIARVAARMSEQRPMGTFSLHENDCSDFVDCVVDEALGYGARFNRDGQHVSSRIGELWYRFEWDGAEAILPGDVVSVRHSPWYPPDPEACWHVGVVGADGMVYDWTKLVSWTDSRYGRHTISEFIRHCTVPGDVIVRRLHPTYRYRIDPPPRLGN